MQLLFQAKKKYMNHDKNVLGASIQYPLFNDTTKMEWTKEVKETLGRENMQLQTLAEKISETDAGFDKDTEQSTAADEESISLVGSDANKEEKGTEEATLSNDIVIDISSSRCSSCCRFVQRMS